MCAQGGAEQAGGGGRREAGTDKGPDNEGEGWWAREQGREVEAEAAAERGTMCVRVCRACAGGRGGGGRQRQKVTVVASRFFGYGLQSRHLPVLGGALQEVIAEVRRPRRPRPFRRNRRKIACCACCAHFVAMVAVCASIGANWVYRLSGACCAHCSISCCLVRSKSACCAAVGARCAAIGALALE